MTKFNVLKFQAPFERLREYNVSPEVKLYKSIILQAIIDISNISDNPDNKRYELDAKNWFFGKSKNFLEVCDKAELEPSEVREMARAAIELNSDVKFYLNPRFCLHKK